MPEVTGAINPLIPNSLIPATFTGAVNGIAADSKIRQGVFHYSSVNSRIINFSSTFSISQALLSLITNNKTVNARLPVSIDTNFPLWSRHPKPFTVMSNIIGHIATVPRSVNSVIMEFNQVSRNYKVDSMIPEVTSILVPSGPTKKLNSTYRVYLDGSDVTDKVISCNVTYSREQYCGEFDITWHYDPDLFNEIDCTDMSNNYNEERILIYINNTLLGRFFIEKREISYSFGTMMTPTSWGRTRPARLSSPYALPMTEARSLWNEDNVARTLAQDLASIGGIALYWNVYNFKVRAGKFQPFNDYPIDGIKTLADAVGGIVTTSRFDPSVFVVYKWK